MSVKTLLLHEESFGGKLVRVVSFDAEQCWVGILLRPGVGKFVFTFDKSNAVDYLVVHILSAAVHNLGHTGGCGIHQVLP